MVVVIGVVARVVVLAGVGVADVIVGGGGSGVGWVRGSVMAAGILEGGDVVEVPVVTLLDGGVVFGGREQLLTVARKPKAVSALRKPRRLRGKSSLFNGDPSLPTKQAAPKTNYRPLSGRFHC